MKDMLPGMQRISSIQQSGHVPDCFGQPQEGRCNIAALLLFS